MSNQTIKNWLKANELPASIEHGLKQFKIDKVNQIKSKSTTEINLMLDYLIQNPSLKNQSNLAIAFRTAIMNLLISKITAKGQKTPPIPQKPQKKAIGIYSERLVTDITEYKAGKSAQRSLKTKRRGKSAIKKRNVPIPRGAPKLIINLRYLPLYKCAYLTYCAYMSSSHIPKEYIEIDNFKRKPKLNKFSGKVEVNEPFNLWAISYDKSNPKRAMYKSYKKICNTIYHSHDSGYQMEKALKLYAKRSGYISRRKQRKKILKQPAYKWTKRGYSIGPKPKYKSNPNPFIRPEPKYNHRNSAQTGYFTGKQANKPVDITKFIPRIWCYKNKSEFEKAEYLLCWARLKNNESVTNEPVDTLKWKHAFNYLYANNISYNGIEKEIIDENMETHKLRLKIFKLINKNGIKHTFAIYKNEKGIYDKENKMELKEDILSVVEEKDNESDDNDIINELDVELESKTKDIIESLEAEAVYDHELEDIDDENNNENNNERRLSHKLVITSKDETFIKEAGLSGQQIEDGNDENVGGDE